MKKLTVATVMLAWSLFCLAGPLRAQARKPVTSQAPIVPMEIEFRYVPQYFMQLIEDNARYSRIEALINDGQCEVILTDKTMNKRVFYANSQERIHVLQASGAEAHLAPVEVAEFMTVDSNPAQRIRLRDAFGQEDSMAICCGRSGTAREARNHVYVQWFRLGLGIRSSSSCSCSRQRSHHRRQTVSSTTIRAGW